MKLKLRDAERLKGEARGQNSEVRQDDFAQRTPRVRGQLK